MASVTAAEVHGRGLGPGAAQDEGEDGQGEGHLPERGDGGADRRGCERNPEGPLFRKHRGDRPWNRNAIRCRFKRLREKLGLEAGVVCYGLRHAFVTDALERGVPIATLAEIVGHADTKMISAVYSHLHERREHLRKAVEQATGLREGAEERELTTSPPFGPRLGERRRIRASAHQRMMRCCRPFAGKG